MPPPLALVLTTIPALAQSPTVRFQFCWIGGGGYTLEGVIGFPKALVGTGVIAQDEVTEFKIRGALNGIPVGSWSLEALTPDTAWILRFDTDAIAFPTGGHRALGSYQAWNATGVVNDCGDGGFGFNGGDYAQDVCINNTYIAASSIDPDTPLPAYSMDLPVTCRASVPVS